MSYRELLDAAKAVNAGETHAAARWVLDLESFIKSGYPLTPHERSYLYRLRRIWKRRAAGLDARWNDYGSAPGNKPRRWPIAPQKPKAPAPAPVAAPVVPPPQPAPPIAEKPKSPEPTKPGLSSLLDKYAR